MIGEMVFNELSVPNAAKESVIFSNIVLKNTSKLLAESGSSNLSARTQVPSTLHTYRDHEA